MSISFAEVEAMFNRAWSHAFTGSKLALTFLFLASLGFLMSIFHISDLQCGPWLSVALIFVPVLICCGVLMGLGGVLIQAYQTETQDESIDIWNHARSSWQTLATSCLFALPFTVVALILWVLTGLVYALETLPTVGPFFTVILAFAPPLLLLILFGILLLVVLMLFFVTPDIVNTELSPLELTRRAAKRMKGSIFVNLLLILLAFAPSLLAWLAYACVLDLSEIHLAPRMPLMVQMLQEFFIFLPLLALLTPATIYFFNFSAEIYAHFNMILAKRSAND